MIGDVLEAAIEPILKQFAEEHGLFFDKKGPRPVRSGNKLCWTDLNQNKHELDFVLERGGTPSKQGVPVAFIETAWRRYTKHSRNKAQEIQGAIIPLLETYSKQRPFIGAVLAGVFTEGALSQLKSLGFAVAYFPYEKIINTFQVVGIDAAFDETTPDAKLARKMALWNRLSSPAKAKVFHSLIVFNRGELDQFMAALKQSIERKIKSIRIVPLHGSAVEWRTLDEAVAFVKNYNEGPSTFTLIRYEVQVLFLNGDKVVGEFGARADALAFLESFRISSAKAQP